jgi:hypothetical protein
MTTGAEDAPPEMFHAPGVIIFPCQLCVVGTERISTCPPHLPTSVFTPVFSKYPQDGPFFFLQPITMHAYTVFGVTRHCLMQQCVELLEMIPLVVFPRKVNGVIAVNPLAQVTRPALLNQQRKVFIQYGKTVLGHAIEVAVHIAIMNHILHLRTFNKINTAAPRKPYPQIPVST